MVKSDYRAAPLSPADMAMLDFAAKLTQRPDAMAVEDVESLRREGFDDFAIHDIVQVTGLFNYYNRLADGLGIDPEPEIMGAGEPEPQSRGEDTSTQTDLTSHD